MVDRTSTLSQGGQRGAKNYDELIKLVFIGDSSVGKTCLLMRFSENRFPEDHMPTIGIDFKIKIMTVGKKRCKMQLWDTAGQERFQTITASYYKGAAGALLVYDASNRSTFLSVTNWIKQIDNNASDQVHKILVANKSDLSNLEVSEDEGGQLAKDYRMQFFATSAKTGENVEDMFQQISQRILTQRQLKKEEQEQKTDAFKQGEQERQ